jgi:hypothetical protein
MKNKRIPIGKSTNLLKLIIKNKIAIVGFLSDDLD